MPEVIIKYKNRRTLQALEDFSKYFDFEISPSKAITKAKANGNGKPATEEINGVTILLGDRSVAPSAMKPIFTGKNIDANELRSKAWTRKK